MLNRLVATRINSALHTRTIKHIWMGNRSKIEVELPPHLKDAKSFDRNAQFEDPMIKYVRPDRKYFVGGWLALCAGGVYFMVLLGGYTRLTHSGLSMVRWRPIEYTYPRDDEEWEKEFNHYKQFPEYEHSKDTCDLNRFKKIYRWEYLHRISGSTLGATYVLPLVGFSMAGWITKKYTKKLAFIGSLGLAQGLIGWWMVKSGLNQPKPDYQTKPRVSTYRLIVHLSTAMTLYSLLVYNALNVLRKPQHLIITPQTYKGMKNLRKLSILLIHLVALNIVSGAAMAGIDAGKVFNTWPTMNGQIIPAGLFKIDPYYKNLFENVICVQFNHRTAAYITYFTSAYIAYRASKMNLPLSAKLSAYLVFALVNAQLYSGITTLLNMAPIHSCSVHQFNGLNVLTATLILLNFSKKPSKVYSKYIKQFA